MIYGKFVCGKGEFIMNLKKIIAVLLAFAFAFSLVACGGQDTEKNTDSEKVRIGALKGPTAMGLVKMLDEDGSSGKKTYDFTLAGTADELTPKFLKGDIDIIVVPSNLGAVLYSKTDKKVKMLGISTLGVIYLAQNGEKTVNKVSDLKGKTVYMTAKGSVPEYAFRHILEKNGLDSEKDVNIIFKNEPSEILGLMSSGENIICVLPEPYLTVAKSKISGLNVCLDLSNEWEKADKKSEFITAGIFARKEFCDKNPEAVKTFLDGYKKSAEFINGDPENGAKLVGKYGIVDENIAKKAIPNCNIVSVTGNELKKSAQNFYNVLFDKNPAFIGGKLPEGDFYY